MIKLISQNPYRILGVFSNSPKKDVLSNLNKMKAFAKVGKSVSFPLDLSSILPTVDRNTITIESAQSQIGLPIDQVKNGMFWFMNVSPIDKIAFNHLTSGNIAQAKDIWNKKTDVSSLTNRMICAMIENDTYALVISADMLFQDYRDEFCGIINNMVKLSSMQMTKMFIDEIVADGSIEIEKLGGIEGVSEDWNSVINNMLVEPLKEEITSAIAEAKKASSYNENYEAGKKLIESTKSALSKLKGILGEKNLEYQMIADKLAQSILQCGINYFNDSEENDAIEKAMQIQSYALSIAEGEIAKDRCKTNVDTLKRIGPEYKVQKEMGRIVKQLKQFNETSSSKNSGTTAAILASLTGSHSLNEIDNFINNCNPDLSSIKNKLGAQNDLYIKVSSAVANAAINALVENINKAQNLAQFSSDQSSLKSSVSFAVSIMNKISSLDMSSSCRSYFNNNNSTLNSINSRLNPSGCYIATMAYGDYDHPQVIVLRGFRDNYLNNREWGKKFIKYYYKHSPGWVERLKSHKIINAVIRKCLDAFVFIIKKI